MKVFFFCFCWGLGVGGAMAGDSTGIAQRDSHLRKEACRLKVALPPDLPQD